MLTKCHQYGRVGAVKGWDLAIEESGYLCSLANSECDGSPPGSGELSVTAESAHHLSSLSIPHCPVLCDQSQSLVHGASPMELQTWLATWTATRAWHLSGCWTILGWMPMRLVLRMVGREFAWRKLCLGNLYVRLNTIMASWGPGPLCSPAAMVSNGSARKCLFWSAAMGIKSVVAIGMKTKSPVLGQLPSSLTTSSQRKHPLDFLLLLCLRLNLQLQTGGKLVQQVLRPKSAARKGLCISVFLLTITGLLHSQPCQF